MNIAILLAAGQSTRAGFNKLEAKLGTTTLGSQSKTVFETSHELLVNHPLIDHVIVVDSDNGGDTRMQSFLNGLDLAQELSMNC